MKQYIDKSALVAEIKRLRMNYGRVFNEYDAGFSEGRSSAFDEVLSFLNTLEVKEIGVDFGDPEGDIGVKWVQGEPVSKDLEEAAHLYVDTTIEYFDSKGNPCCYSAFKAGAQWQKTKAYEWLKEYKEHPLIGCEDPCLSGYLTDEFIEDFKKAMEE